MLLLNDTNYTFTTNANLWLQLNTNEAAFYEDYSVVNNNISNGVIGNKTATGTNATPVTLPYEVRVTPSYGSTTYPIHLLTYTRRNNQYDIKTITERNYNVYYAQMSSGTTLTPATNNEYYVRIYKALKFAIEDNILDDNNNIVRYSLPNEISVVRLKLRYTYGR